MSGPYTFHSIHLRNSTSKRGQRQWSSGARANKASTCSMSALLLFCWKLCSTTLNSWGYSAVITMPTQKQRLVNLTQTARHEVKMDTSTFLILTHWSPGLFFPEVRQGFPNPWGPMVIHHFDSSTPHHHPQILQAENCLPTWYIRRWCCWCCHRHWCHIWDRNDDRQHWRPGRRRRSAKGKLFQIPFQPQLLMAIYFRSDQSDDQNNNAHSLTIWSLYIKKNQDIPAFKYYPQVSETSKGYLNPE